MVNSIYALKDGSEIWALTKVTEADDALIYNIQFVGSKNGALVTILYENGIEMNEIIISDTEIQIIGWNEMTQTPSSYYDWSQGGRKIFVVKNNLAEQKGQYPPIINDGLENIFMTARLENLLSRNVMQAFPKKIEKDPENLLKDLVILELKKSCTIFSRDTKINFEDNKELSSRARTILAFVSDYMKKEKIQQKNICAKTSPADLIRKYLKKILNQQEKYLNVGKPIPKKYLMPQKIILSPQNVKYLLKSKTTKYIGANKDGTEISFYWEETPKSPAIEARIKLEDDGRYILAYMKEKSSKEKSEILWDMNSKDAKKGILTISRTKDALEDIYDGEER